MKPLILGLIGLVSAVGPASAQNLPRFDVDRHCQEVASFGGAPSEVIRSGCFDMEQSAYDKLKDSWSDIPGSTRKHCLEVATFGGPGSYSLLEGCLQMERSAREQNQSRRFKY